MVDIQKESLPENAISSYNSTSITIKNVVYENFSIVTADRIINSGEKTNMIDLDISLISDTILEGIEVVIVGHNQDFSTIPVALIRAFAEKNIGVEFMNFGAACRTFNILLAEGRKVLGVFLG
jgi:uncharacterized protein